MVCNIKISLLAHTHKFICLFIDFKKSISINLECITTKLWCYDISLLSSNDIKINIS